MIKSFVCAAIASGLCIMIQPAFAAGGEGNTDYIIYGNSLFGFEVLLPANFQIGPPPANNDGRRFKGYDGKVEILAYAGYLQEDLAAEKEKRLGYLETRKADVTYQTTDKTWFVLSGHNADGTIFYDRAIKTENCFGDVIIATVSITYPPEYKDDVEPYLGYITKSLHGCQPRKVDFQD